MSTPRHATQSAVSIKKLSLAAVISVILSGCGGGGSTPANNKSPTPVPVPPTNSTGCTAACGGNVTPVEPLKLTDSNIGRVLFRSYQAGSKGIFTGFPVASINNNYACTSGTYSGENIDKNGDGMISVGDIQRKRFANCQTSVPGVQFTANGGFDYTIQTIANGQVTGWRLFNDDGRFGFQYGDAQGCQDKPCDYFLSGRDLIVAGNKISASNGLFISRVNWLGSSKLTIEANKDSFFQRAASATENNQINLFMSLLADDKLFGFSNGNDSISHTVTIETPAVLRFSDNLNNGFPSEGQLKVVGANNANAVLTANGLTGAVSIQFDNNGDGQFDSTRSTTWTALAAE